MFFHSYDWLMDLIWSHSSRNIRIGLGFDWKKYIDLIWRKKLYWILDFTHLCSRVYAYCGILFLISIKIRRFNLSDILRLKLFGRALNDCNAFIHVANGVVQAHVQHQVYGHVKVYLQRTSYEFWVACAGRIEQTYLDSDPSGGLRATCENSCMYDAFPSILAFFPLRYQSRGRLFVASSQKMPWPSMSLDVSYTVIAKYPTTPSVIHLET